MSTQRKIGLLMGSFNPVHMGHLIIAEYMATTTELEQVWFIVSPHNPLKKRTELAPDQDRLTMVRMALEDNPLLSASDVEFQLPKPSYTIHTLAHLHESFPETEFTLIIGSDNLAVFHLWKDYRKIMNSVHIFVYRRPGYEPGKLASHQNVTLFDAPWLDISSTLIRQRLKANQSIRYLVPVNIRTYITENKLYRATDV